MSQNYLYSEKDESDIESLAEGLLIRHPYVLNGNPDIELIVEKYPCTIIARPGLSRKVDAYLPRIAGIILIDSEIENDLSRYRLTLAEEISHQELEPELWPHNIAHNGGIPSLPRDVFLAIEGDVNRMFLAVLMPKTKFIKRFGIHKTTIEAEGSHDGSGLSKVIEKLAEEFEVTFDAAKSRCELLKLIQEQVQKKQLPGGVTI